MRDAHILKRKGQSTAEFAILIGLVVAVAIAMQTYVKRGLQARSYDAANTFYDKLSTDANWGDISNVAVTGNKQFEDTTVSSKSTQNVLDDKNTLNMETGGKVTRDFRQETKQAKDDYQKRDY